MEQARVASANDIAALQDLFQSALRELEGQRGGALLAGRSARLGSQPGQSLADALDDRDRLVVVGTLDGVEVGFAVARCDRRGDHPLGVIEAIFVLPLARQVGVGEAIVDVVVGWCLQHGCRGLDAPALPGSRSTKAFFEDNGFVTRLLVMHHPLPGPAGGRP